MLITVNSQCLLSIDLTRLLISKSIQNWPSKILSQHKVWFQSTGPVLSFSLVLQPFRKCREIIVFVRNYFKHHIIVSFVLQSEHS